MSKTLKHSGLTEAKKFYDKYNWESSKYKPMQLHEFRHYIQKRYARE